MSRVIYLAIELSPYFAIKLILVWSQFTLKVALCGINSIFSLFWFCYVTFLTLWNIKPKVIWELSIFWFKKWKGNMNFFVVFLGSRKSTNYLLNIYWFTVILFQQSWRPIIYLLHIPWRVVYYIYLWITTPIFSFKWTLSPDFITFNWQKF